MDGNESNGNKMDLSIVVPFYNEQDNIIHVYNALSLNLQDSGISYELIFVNNGSSDMTPDKIAKLRKSDSKVVKVDILKNQGYSYGIRQGLSKANGEYIGYVDGDDAFCAAAINKIYGKAISEHLDICKGRRVNRQDGFLRTFASLFFNSIFNVLFINKIKDVNAKPKIMKSKVFNELNLKSKDWFIDAEILIKSLQKGYKIGELQIKPQKRIVGSSSVKPSTTVEFLKNMLSYRWKLWTNQKL